ncbi:MAG TPA: LLM class F420-dependent oxidoreductase [Thermoleophilaceae bacterium]|nr:LLM class F420-dependent oxidoreductase [Thermoleophilaceae bacterium]
MRIGLFLAYWPWFSAEEQIELARQADREGLDSVWVSEAWGQDVVSVLGHLSAVTERVGLGSGLLQIPARTPAMTAMTAATLDVLSGGRFRLGLGVSGPQVSEGWHGVRFARPLARTREYVEVVRAALAREGPLEYHGEEFQLPLDGSELGKPLKLLAKPVQERIPVYLGAIGPKAVEQAARIADGWLRFMFSPERADELLEPFRGTDVDISPVVMVCVHEDRGRARGLARPWLALYMGAMGAKQKNFYVETADRFGHGESARQVQELFQAGDREGAAAALSNEFIESSAICCPPGELDDRLDDYERAGATTLLAMPFGDRPRIVEALAAAARGAAA